MGMGRLYRGKLCLHTFFWIIGAPNLNVSVLSVRRLMERILVTPKGDISMLARLLLPINYVDGLPVK